MKWSYLKWFNCNSGFLLFAFNNIQQFGDDLVRNIVNVTSTLINITHCNHDNQNVNVKSEFI